MSLIRKYGYKGIGSKKASLSLDGTVVNQKALETILEMDAELGEKALLNQLIVGSERKDLALDLSKLSISDTLIYSESDPLVNSRWIVDFQFSSSNLTAFALPSSGHMLPLEKPFEMASLISTALNF